MARGELCKIPGCKTVIKTWGNYCSKHRTRKWRHGDPNYISPNWANLKKGQVHQLKSGYQNIFDEKRGKRVLYHRYLMEQHLGRLLDESEVLHHVNGIKTDNRIENLVITTHLEHKSKYHNYGRWSIKHERCIKCSSTERRHAGFGLCWKCRRHKG